MAKPRTKTPHNATKGGKRTTEHGSWTSMLKRCYTTTDASYPDVGGVGIKVCPRWQNFAPFLADMGPRPSPRHELTRLDLGADYTPLNTVWMTQKDRRALHQQGRLITALGRTQLLAAWAREAGIPPNVISGRLNTGWDPDVAVTTQRYGKHVVFRGEAVHVTDLADKYGLCRSTLWTRLSSGWPVEEAVTTPPRAKGPRDRKPGRRPKVQLEVRGETKLLVEWAALSGTKYRLILGRLRLGWPPEEAVFGRNPPANKD